MVIKHKRAGNTVITVIDGAILSINKSTDEIEDFYLELKEAIRTYNGNFHDEELALSAKAEVINMMIPPKPKAETPTLFSGNLESINVQGEMKTEEIAFKNVLEAKRVADVSDSFEYDSQGKVYLKGYSVPIPTRLAQALLDAKYNPESTYTVESLENFWKWCLLNPNKKARTDLFDWFDTGEFVITDQGLILAYRNVDVKSEGHSKELDEFVSKAYVKVKKHKQSPKRYVVLKKQNTYELIFLKKNPNAVDDENCLGLLSDLYADSKTSESGVVYTDNYTGTMTIKIGEEVSMPREECDENHQESCSRGLHFMSPAYGLRLGSTTLVVLINPYNIVAFPSYDNTKGRSCAYFPIGLAEKENGKIITLDAGTYEYEYSGYNTQTLDELMSGESLESLKERNLIADDITETDFRMVKDNIDKVIGSRVVEVE